MAKKNFLTGKEKELQELAERYEKSKKEGKTLYLDPFEYADLADWYVTRQMIAEAEQTLEDALSIHPDNEVLVIEKCHLLLDQEEVDEADKLSKKIFTSGSDQALILRGNILLRKNKIKKAKELFGQIKEPNDLYNTIDVIYAYLDNYCIDEATELLLATNDQFEQEEPFLALKADYFYHIEKFDEAIQCYNTLIDNNPYSPIYWAGIARCYLSQGAYDKTIEACEYAQVSDENYFEPHLIKAQAYAELGNNEAAYQTYKKLFEIGGLPAEAWYDLHALYLMDKGNFQEAFDLYESIESLPEKEPNPVVDGYRAYNMGLCKMQFHEFEEAHKYFTEAIELRPNIINAYLKDGLACALLERNNDALLIWEKAIKVSPTPDTLFDLGRITMQVGYLSLSLKSFQMAYDLDNETPLVNEHIAFIYLLTGKRKEFEEYNLLAKHAFPEHVIAELYAKLDKADKLLKIEIAQQYFEQYVLIPYSTINPSY